VGTILKPDKDSGAISVKLTRTLGRGAFSCVWLAKDISESRLGQEGRLVAVKLSPGTENDPIARLTFEREAEILRHISHSNIVPLLASFTSHIDAQTHPTPVLVLPYIPGADLLDLVNSDVRHARLGEGVLRRMVRELIGVLAWLHAAGKGVGVVHRDVKLENVLLTTPNPTMSTPSPLIKLTDFGLARVIRTGTGLDGEVELLSARCGSEAYAAPELVVGGGSGVEIGMKTDGVFTKSVRGWYDGRATDAWAVGVLVYALVCRALPFGEGVPKLERGGQEIMLGREGERGRERYWGREKEERERRSWLMRIARGEYEWPFPSPDFKNSSTPSDPHALHPHAPINPSDELSGADLAHIPGVRMLVGKLLVRDPRRRARLADLLKGGDEWLGTGRAVAGGEGKVEGVFEDVAWREFE
jgi:serine/threonine protein kinase